MFFFTLYSLALRLGEGLRLQVGDIDVARGRVHIRDAKGNRDRRSSAASDTQGLATLLARASQPGAVVSESPRRFEGGSESHDSP